MRSLAPRSIASGQYVMSTLALAPSAQARRQVARWTQTLRRPYGRVAIAFGAGHQCQPSSLWARATRRPISPMGTGGIGGPSPPGKPVSPASPETPQSRSTRT